MRIVVVGGVCSRTWSFVCSSRSGRRPGALLSPPQLPRHNSANSLQTERWVKVAKLLRQKPHSPTAPKPRTPCRAGRFRTQAAAALLRFARDGKEREWDLSQRGSKSGVWDHSMICFMFSNNFTVVKETNTANQEMYYVCELVMSPNTSWLYNDKKKTRREKMAAQHKKRFLIDVHAHIWQGLLASEKNCDKAAIRRICC